MLSFLLLALARTFTFAFSWRFVFVGAFFTWITTPTIRAKVVRYGKAFTMKEDTPISLLVAVSHMVERNAISDFLPCGFAWHVGPY